MFGYANGSWLFLAVFDRYLKGLFDPVGSLVDAIVRSIPLADYVEGVAGIDSEQFVFRGMVDNVFARKLQLPVIVVLPIESGFPFW